MVLIGQPRPWLKSSSADELEGPPHGGVAAARSEQLVVRADLDDPPVVEHDDPVGGRAVCSRCAMTIVVRPCETACIAAVTRASVARSRFEVASSSSSIAGSTSSARASAISWRWPADSDRPRSASSCR